MCGLETFEFWSSRVKDASVRVVYEAGSFYGESHFGQKSGRGTHFTLCLLVQCIITASLLLRKCQIGGLFISASAGQCWLLMGAADWEMNALMTGLCLAFTQDCHTSAFTVTGSEPSLVGGVFKGFCVMFCVFFCRVRCSRHNDTRICVVPLNSATNNKTRQLG